MSSLICLSINFIFEGFYNWRLITEIGKNQNLGFEYMGKSIGNKILGWITWLRDELDINPLITLETD